MRNVLLRQMNTDNILFVAGCTTLAPSELANRHNKVAGYTHWTISLQVTDRYY
jgi:hypothetical protein